MDKNQYIQPSNVVTILFNVYVIGWWLEIGERIPFLGAIRIEFILGSVLVAIAILSKLNRKSKNVGYSRDIVPWIYVLLVVLLISVLLAENKHIAWTAYVDRVLKYAVMTLFISQFVTSPQTLKYFSFSTFIAFLKVGQEAMHGKLTGGMVWYNQGIPRLHGTRGTMFGHPNSLSGKTISLVPFLWYLFPFLKKRWVKVLVIIQIIFTCNIVLFTGSRTGYVTLLALLAIVVFLGGNKFRYITYIVIFGAITIANIPDVYVDRFTSSFTGQEVVGKSSDARRTLFMDSLTVFAENPMGVGLNCFRIVQSKAGRRGQDTHNLYTQLLAETGIQGFLAFMGFVYVLANRVSKIRKAYKGCVDKLLLNINNHVDEYRESIDKELDQCRFLYAISTGLLVFISVRLFLGLLGHDLLEIYWWVAAGLAISLSNILDITILRVDEVISNSD